MKEYTTKDIRNVVLLGATKSGKTTLAEAMLYEGKVIEILGHKNVSFTLNVYGSANMQQKVKCMNLLNDLL